MSAGAETMEDDDTVVVDTSQDMEEGELSDDGLPLPQKPPTRTPIRMDLPDLLKELKGADEFKKVDAETFSKMSARAERFQTGNSVSFEEISKLYTFMKVSPIERESVNKLETIFVWSPDKLDLADVQRFFSSYSPLSVAQLSRHSAQAGVNIMSFARTECAREPQVVWATPANCAKALLSLSKGVGAAGKERVVKHVLDMEQDGSYVTESSEETDLIHPDDIGVELPDDEGPWRLAVGDIPIMLLRFGRKTDLTLREKQAAARHLGVLSKTRREELLREQEKALQREQEKKKPVDKKNPWGGVAENWALESRGRVGTDFDDFLAAYSRDRRRKDWDDPADEDRERDSPRHKTGGVRDRLGWGPNRSEAREETEEAMEWSSKMKKPRLGMVADLVEKETVRTPLRRKLPVRYDEEEEEEEFDLRQRVRVEDRVVRTAGRRLGDRFRGGRLEGRLGVSRHQEEDEDTGRRSRHQEEDEDTGRRSRLSSRLGARRGVRSGEDSGDSLERDNGEDLRGKMMDNNMVIRVTRTQDEMQMDEDVREEPRRGERGKNNEEREMEIRQRLREIQREKERMEERRQKSEISRSSRKERDQGRADGEDREFMKKVKERARKLEKLKSEKREESEESDTDSSESEDSDTGSDSSEDSSESESSESESESGESSSDSEEERRRRRDRERSSASRHKQGRSHRDRDKKSASKYSHKDSKSSSSKSSKKDKQEESKKAAELRDQLRNYLKKAKEAKEKKKK